MVKIFIDPGHGGTDPGAVGNGLQEKNVTLQIAKQVRDLLKKYENVQVRMSRTGDTYPSLTERVKSANDWQADFFLSIHINAGGGTGYEDYVHTSTSARTKEIQSILHAEIIKKIDMVDRGMKTANYQVLRTTNMPAILTENGFIDNKNDAEKLKDSKFIEALAEGHVNGLVQAFGLKKIPENTSKGEIRMFKPTSTILKNEFIKMLEKANTDGILKSQDWAAKARDDKLKLDDALALIAVIYNRGK